MKRQKQSGEPDKPTLAQLLATLTEPETYLFVIQDIGPGASEAVGGGTVAELAGSRCVEVCRNCTVEKITLDVEVCGWEGRPVMLVTIGPRGAK